MKDVESGKEKFAGPFHSMEEYKAWLYSDDEEDEDDD
jgi:hypothetical protein